MLEKRQNPRYQTMGRARIVGAIKEDILLKDISVTGCCLEYKSDQETISIKTEDKFKLNIKPEKEAHVGNFDLEVECKWIKWGKEVSEFGFLITASPVGRHFHRYVDYLAYKSNLT